MKCVWLVLRSLWELGRYDVMIRAFGFRRALRSAIGARRQTARVDPGFEDEVCDAMNLALSLYWKRVFCLQRSVTIARLLLSGGLDAHVVIGCRPEPFTSHAWVEIDGRVVNDSQAFPKLLYVLERI